MTFAFYIRSEQELNAFKEWQDSMKEIYHGNWLFTSMETKPSYMSSKNFSSNSRKLQGMPEMLEQSKAGLVASSSGAHTLSIDKTGSDLTMIDGF